MAFLTAVIADRGVSGSRCSLEDCSSARVNEAAIGVAIDDRSASRTRCIVEDCLAVSKLAGLRSLVIYYHLRAGRSRCVVEDYPAWCSSGSYCFTNKEALHNAAIVDNAGAANN